MCYWKTELGKSYQGLLETYYVLLYISDYIILVDAPWCWCQPIEFPPAKCRVTRLWKFSLQKIYNAVLQRIHRTEGREWEITANNGSPTRGKMNQRKIKENIWRINWIEEDCWRQRKLEEITRKMWLCDWIEKDSRREAGGRGSRLFRRCEV